MSENFSRGTTYGSKVEASLKMIGAMFYVFRYIIPLKQYFVY